MARINVHVVYQGSALYREQSGFAEMGHEQCFHQVCSLSVP